MRIDSHNSEENKILECATIPIDSGSIFSKEMITSSPKDSKTNANIILGLAGAIDDNKQETEKPAPTEYIKTVDKGIGSCDFTQK